ncbi:MAG: hypothetical protein H7287_08580 [Thermoleophilia bacterium]|nr:hypothetical protein [Thermoleophilia bacterium]
MANEKLPLSTERLDSFFQAVPRYVPAYRDRMLHWLASADHVTGRVASGASIYEEQAVFVVRLAGILSDLRRRFGGPSSLTPEQLAEGGYREQLREEHRAKVVAAIAALHARLTEDELLWLELRRHEQSHPWLDGYRPKASHGDRWDQWESAMLDKRVLPLDEVIDRCAALESAHGDFVSVAVSIARKVFQHVGAVQLTMIPLMAGFR